MSGGKLSERHVDKDANILFNKLFTFSSKPEWSLPLSTSICSENRWSLQSLQTLKKDLNSTKSLLNDKDERWHKHTEEINKAGLILNCVKKIVKPELPTQAWCKFYEIATSFPIIPKDIEVLRSFHLCEAPGAFISALNYYLCANHQQLEWEWYANTLNPYYEGHSIRKVIVDDRLLFNTMSNWHFGTDNTGDIMASRYLANVKDFFSEKGPVHLVTADGSFCCMDNPGEQELTVSNLQFTEMLIALQVLANGGTLVIKKFTFFECISVCTIYLLNCIFEKVSVFKPVTSRCGNSEVYVVCIGYKGKEMIESLFPLMQQCLSSKEMALFDRGSIPLSFIEEIEKCCCFFAEYQVSAIKENLELYGKMTREETMHLTEVKDHVANLYITRYSLVFLDEEEYYQLYGKKKRSVLTAFGKEHVDLKMLYFKIMGSSYDKMQVVPSMTWNNFLLDCEGRLNACFPTSNKRSLTSFSWLPVWQEVRQSMKLGYYKSWLITGKSFAFVMNSKFCNPFLLQLWNDLIRDNQQHIQPENHQGQHHSYWDWDDLIEDLTESNNPLICEVVVNVDLTNANDNFLAHYIKEILNNGSKVQDSKLENVSELEYCNLQKIVVLDVMTLCHDSFCPEVFTCEVIVQAILKVIQILKEGDSLIVSIPFPLTRFIVGVLYMAMSFFECVATILPSDMAPALMGQVWILRGFQKKSWCGSFIKYMEHILNFKREEDISILEIVPIVKLCGGQFYKYLLNINQTNMLQRLRSLISREKQRAQNEGV